MLLVAPGIIARNKKLLVTKGIATSNKKLLVATGDGWAFWIVPEPVRADVPVQAIQPPSRSQKEDHCWGFGGLSGIRSFMDRQG